MKENTKAFVKNILLLLFFLGVVYSTFYHSGISPDSVRGQEELLKQQDLYDKDSEGEEITSKSENFNTLSIKEQKEMLQYEKDNAYYLALDEQNIIDEFEKEKEKFLFSDNERAEILKKGRPTQK